MARHLTGDVFACRAVGCATNFRRSRAVPRRMRRTRIKPVRRTSEQVEARYIERYGALADVVRTIPCIVVGCGKTDVEVAHVKTKASGGTPWIKGPNKRPVGNLVALCHEHHAEQHTIGIRSFEDAHSFVLRTRTAHDDTPCTTLRIAAVVIGAYAVLMNVDPETNERVR